MNAREPNAIAGPARRDAAREPEPRPQPVPRASASHLQAIYDSRLMTRELRGTCTATSEVLKAGYVRVSTDPRFGLVLFVKNTTPEKIGLPGDKVVLRGASADEWGSMPTTPSRTHPTQQPYAPVSRSGKVLGLLVKSAGRWFFGRVDLPPKVDSWGRSEPTSPSASRAHNAEDHGGFDGYA